MGCPDKTQVALFAGGQLPEAEVLRMEAHLDDCEDCLALIADAATGGSATTATQDVEGQRDSAWIYLVAALARRSDRPPPSDDVEPEPHERIGPYVVKGVLGRGGMGIVYRTVHAETHQDAAVKTVAGSSPKALAAMRQEIAFLRSQRHPGIIRVFEDGVIDGDPWYAMELLEGRTLEDFNRATLPSGADRLRDILSLYIRLCGPLAFVHRQGVVHCDLKPANVFIRSDEQPVLMDFGLLSRAGGAIGREVLETGGHLRGTLPYMAPELIRGQIPDARADLYALGCLLHESLTGRPPFFAPTVNALLDAHLNKEPTPASRLVPGLPPELDEILGALLSKRPDRRIGDADVVAEQLSSLVHPRSGARSPAPSAAPPAKPYLFRPRMVGRDAVVAAMEGHCEEASRGRGRFLLVSGESGIGKTFLASEVTLRAARAGFDVVTGECTPLAATGRPSDERTGSALEPFRNLIQSAADACRKGSLHTPVELFGSPLAIQVLAKYEPTLLFLLEGPDAVEPAPLPPAAERERILRALSDMLERLVERRPLLLIVDDLQWADDLSLAFLDALADDFCHRHPLLILALYRSEEVTEPIARLCEKVRTPPIALDRLDVASLGVLVGDLLSKAPPDDLVSFLAAQSEGNPFFVAEYLRAAASEGLLERTAQGWGVSQAPSAPSHRFDRALLPGSLQALLERRLSLLSADAQRVAEAGAVLGREFPSSMIAGMLEQAPSRLDAVLTEMVERQLVQRVSVDSVRFLHDKAREAAYARIEADRRRQLHHAAAVAIEARHVERAARAPHYAVLAYHYRRGGDAVRAIDYFEKAAERALSISANADAVRLFEEASETSVAAGIRVPDERRASWERRTGDALQGLGRLSESKDHLLRAVTLLGHPLPASEAALGRGILAKLAREVGHRWAPARWMRADAASNAAMLEVARAYDRLMQIYFYRGEYTPLFFANLATLDFAQRAAPSPTRAVAYANAAATAGIVPVPRLVTRYFRLADETLRDVYDPEVESYVEALRARYLSGLARWKETAIAAHRVMDLAATLGFGRRWDEGAGLRCDVGWGRDFEECLAWCNRMLESCVRRNDSQAMCWGFLRRAEVHVARGDLAQAEENLARAERLVAELGLPEQLRALALRAYLLLADSRADEALQAADQAAERVEKAGPVHNYCIGSYALIAEVSVAAVARASARQSRSSLRARAKRDCAALGRAARIFPIARPRHCLHEGTRRWLAGHRGAAVELWKRGRATAAALDIPHEEALLTLELARRAPAGGRTAVDPAGARDVLARLGVRDGAIQPFE